MWGRVRRRRLRVGTFRAKTVYCRNIIGEFVLLKGLVRRGQLIVGTYSARSS